MSATGDLQGTKREAASSNGRRIPKLIASILACEAIGGIGSVFTINSIPTWYVSIQKPWFTPPNWLFGPVWITLFLLMGVSVFLLYVKIGKRLRQA